ncbi:hypothetical protein HBB16_09590, partial [Pseudonocardia sp. MCCB 268]|nr:hypothetical protein [Pseudonocardia cytotoxica]
RYYFVQLRIAKVKQTTTNGDRQHLQAPRPCSHPTCVPVRPACAAEVAEQRSQPAIPPAAPR